MSRKKERKLKAFKKDGLRPPGLMIRILRYANIWTAEKLIDEMNTLQIDSPNIKPADISRYENGESFPSEPTIQKLCHAFKVSPSFLFISEETHPETIEYLVKLLPK